MIAKTLDMMLEQAGPRHVKASKNDDSIATSKTNGYLTVLQEQESGGSSHLVVHCLLFQSFSFFFYLY
jgi:hypothetical protein